MRTTRIQTDLLLSVLSAYPWLENSNETVHGWDCSAHRRQSVSGSAHRRVAAARLRGDRSRPSQIRSDGPRLGRSRHRHHSSRISSFTRRLITAVLGICVAEPDEVFYRNVLMSAQHSGCGGARRRQAFHGHRLGLRLRRRRGRRHEGRASCGPARCIRRSSPTASPKKYSRSA